MDLSIKKCVPCEGGIPPLTQDKITEMRKQIGSNWEVKENKMILKEFALVNYLQTIDFVNKVAELAQNEGHHPVMHVYFSKVIIELSTHAVNGLSENDFILAAKIDNL